MEKINILGFFDKAKAPKGAELAKLNPTKEFIEAFYRFTEVKFNDGTRRKILEHKSEDGFIWKPSCHNSNFEHFLETNYFLKIN